MLKYQLIHPEILRGLGEAGHGAQVLIADGNYPLGTGSHPSSRRIYLNLAPNLVRVTDVLKELIQLFPNAEQRERAASKIQDAESAIAAADCRHRVRGIHSR